MSLGSFFRRPAPPARPARARPAFEILEGRQLLTATISGFVFDDRNATGLKDAGEPGLAGSNLELHDASGAVVATAVSDGNGFYQFTKLENVSTTPATNTVVATFDPAKTGWTKTADVKQFDPSKGTLTSVAITSTATLNADIVLENIDDVPGDISGTVSGTVTVTAPGAAPLTTPVTVSDSFSAPAFDGATDLSGPDSHDSGTLTRTGTQSVTLTSPSDLTRFTGGGSVTLTGRSAARISADGPGNVAAVFSAMAGAQVQVTYTYTPNNSLQPGNYTIVQATEPDRIHFDGKESSGGVVLPNSTSFGSQTHDSIPVTLGSSGISTDNNFAEVLPGVLSGYVYLDANKNGVRDAGERGFGGITVRLGGSNDVGVIGAVFTVTRADGSYVFEGLRPGNYTVTEVNPPAGFLIGPTTPVNLTPQIGGSATPQIPGIVIVPAGVKPENDFSHLTTGGPITQPSKFNLLSSNLRLRRR